MLTNKQLAAIKEEVLNAEVIYAIEKYIEASGGDITYDVVASQMNVSKRWFKKFMNGRRVISLKKMAILSVNSGIQFIIVRRKHEH